MSRRRSRRAQRARKKNLGGYILIAVVAVALVAAFAVQSMKSKEAAQFDKITFCPKDGAHSVTAIMIDQTDALSAIQQASLRNELQKVQDEIPTHGKLEIYAVGNTVSKTLAPVFSMCNPGRGKDINPLFGNPQRVERQWKEAFAKPIDDILSALLNAPDAKESPILESIQSITVTAFNNPASERAERRLIVASDMIHYTPQLSLYHLPSDFASLRETDYIKKMHSDLRDVKVELLMFRRSNGAKVQNQEFIQFWDDFFKDQGASLERVYSISG